ncbi:S-adenosyl-L-methionine-dependent methyltransferase [Artomyces pyxidatus]|uniref:S-adenosyl-L-methionine-dependent methyltransferase n=1 Tax=Artomyces pyxidatus TaxID=48021 RepID=A0ACB8TCU7_9AGAM|nr:S-adenosyl-L-methionine-dependent methyltransferase [Artomyces pyxidatus]
MDRWRISFPTVSLASRDRVSVRNPKTAMRIAESFMNNRFTQQDEPKVVIEAFPGPGALSRALLTYPPSKLRKLIILEDHQPYLDYLLPLADADPRVTIIPKSGFTWDTYSEMEEDGVLDVEKVAWGEKLHPNLHFITHIPRNVAGEQLVAQLFRCIPEKTWLFKYGRVPMSFVVGERVWRRVASPPTKVNAERCKLSVIAEAVSDFSLSLSPENLSPFDDHFHPARQLVREGGKTDHRRVGIPMVTANITPFADQIIAKGKLDQWDYLTRRLFVLKSTPLRKVMSSVAPGADTLLKMITDKSLPSNQYVDINKPVRLLTVADWALIARAFDAWPFAPEDLTIDSYVTHYELR